MQFFLGCDTAKTKLDFCLINEQGVAQWTDTIANNTDAIATFILMVAGAYGPAEIICVTESTGTMHFTLAEVCAALNVTCRVCNPILTKQQLRTTIRGAKTDRTDALLIARLGLRGEGRIYTPELYLHTKYAARAQQQLTVMSSALQQYQQHIDTVLDTALSQAARTLLSQVRVDFQAARQQFLRDVIASAPPHLMQQLQTIPGVGPYIAASLIGEIQDARRFSSAKALVAYAGLDPKIRQSGKSLNSTGRLTKRGSSYLRRNIFIAASVARQYDPQFKALYDKKRAEGKSYKVATCVVARKLLAVVRSIWLNDTPYKVPSSEIG